MITIYTDGACAGNPGKVGIGYLLYDENNTLIKKESIALGVQTNNFAEYMALIFPLIDVLNQGRKKCRVFTDSKLVCEQIKGGYKVKNNNIYPFFVLAKRIISQLEDFQIQHIDREQNKEADKLAKKATGFLT